MIFDTDVVIWILRRQAEALEFVRSIDYSERNVSVVSYLELLRGCRDTRELRDLGELVNEWFAEVVPLTPHISESAATLMRRFTLARRPGVDDVLVAATAISRGETLTTGNLKHFDFIPGLTLKPFRPSVFRRGR